VWRRPRPKDQRTKGPKDQRTKGGALAACAACAALLRQRGSGRNTEVVFPLDAGTLPTGVLLRCSLNNGQQQRNNNNGTTLLVWSRCCWFGLVGPRHLLAALATCRASLLSLEVCVAFVWVFFELTLDFLWLRAGKVAAHQLLVAVCSGTRRFYFF